MTELENRIFIFDLPVEFLVDNDIYASTLNRYKKLTYKIKSAIFVFCITGKINITINLKKHLITSKQVVILLPYSFIQINQISDDAKFWFFGFSSQFLNHIHFWEKISNYIVRLINFPIIPLKAKRVEIYRDTFTLIKRLNNIENISLSSPILHSIANLLLLTILDICQNNNITSIFYLSHSQKILSEFIQLAFKNYMTEHKVTFYAKKLGLSLSYFCSIINTASGKKAQEIIAHLIILDAKVQLKNSSIHINMVGLSLGFETPTTFNRFFRKYAGMTPKQYRNT